jgi:dUTP pyrophosphatase
MLNSVEVKILDDRLKQMMIGRATDGSAAIDLHACIGQKEFIEPGEILKISSGLSIFINSLDYCAMILPRSGLGLKGLVIANTVGLIDSDFQGEIMLTMLNRNSGKINGEQVQCISPMDRIAQLVFLPISRPEFNFVEEFSEKTDRGSSGFGSTGK